MRFLGESKTNACALLIWVQIETDFLEGNVSLCGTFEQAWWVLYLCLLSRLENSVVDSCPCPWLRTWLASWLSCLLIWNRLAYGQSHKHSSMQKWRVRGPSYSSNFNLHLEIRLFLPFSHLRPMVDGTPMFRTVVLVIFLLAHCISWPLRGWNMVKEEDIKCEGRFAMLPLPTCDGAPSTA